MLSGTHVLQGNATMLVCSVGLFSQEGIIKKLITGVGKAEVLNVSLSAPSLAM